MLKKDKTGKENTKNDMKDIEIPIEEPLTAEGTGQDDKNKIKVLEKQVNELNDRYLRKLAEFENYKRRTDSERSEFFAYASEKLISEMIPVLDDFDRVMKSYDEKHDSELFKKGVELVYDKFKKVLEKQGLKEMDSNGKEFDVTLHEALMQQPDENHSPDTVLDTAEKGYYLKDKVLRHAKVIVSAKPE
jgi:molecular chaperone GrpE